MRKELFDIDANLALSEDVSVAKHVYLENGTQRYYVKVCVRGNDAGFFVNPQSMWFNGLNQKPHDKRTVAKSVYEFKKVTEESFKKYLHFLKTKNQVFLRQAQQENING